MPIVWKGKLTMKSLIAVLLLIASPALAQPTDLKSANDFCRTKIRPGSVNLEPNLDPEWEDVCRAILNKWRQQQVEEYQKRRTETEKATRGALENLVKQK
jgi:hypothetical protein